MSSVVSTPRRLLVVGPSWIGDMVLAQSLFITLKQRTPDVAIDVLAPAWSRALLARMPEVHEALEMPLGHGELALTTRYSLGRGLRERHYAQAIVLPGSLKAALVPYWARIPQRTGYRGELRWGFLNDIHPLDKQRLTMTVQRFVALALPREMPLPTVLPVPRLRVDTPEVAASVAALKLSPDDAPILALCPGAEYGAAKRWPVEHYAAVARTKVAQGWQVWIFGSAKEAAIAAAIVGEASGKRVVNLAGKTTLAQAIDLLSLATAVVSNDSGLMHIAAALDRPLVAIYGSSDPGFTPPMQPQAKILRLDLECSPCFQRECPYGHYRCLRELLPAQVLRALEELL